MQKIYIVYFDNGQQWEDHHVYTDRVFFSKENAEAYAQEKNDSVKTFTPSVTKEEYYSSDLCRQNDCSYEQYIDYEAYDWSVSTAGNYYVKETDIHP